MRSITGKNYNYTTVLILFLGKNAKYFELFCMMPKITNFIRKKSNATSKPTIFDRFRTSRFQPTRDPVSERSKVERTKSIPDPELDQGELLKCKAVSMGHCNITALATCKTSMFSFSWKARGSGSLATVNDSGPDPGR